MTAPASGAPLVAGVKPSLAANPPHNGDTDDKYTHARENAKGWLASIEEMLERLNGADKDDPAELNDAQEAINESILSVQVRSGWVDPGTLGARSGEEAAEYYILLTTGGPSLRIIGRLTEHCEPATAELQMQDWGTPWIRYPAPEATLLAFAQNFWFGE